MVITRGVLDSLVTREADAADAAGAEDAADTADTAETAGADVGRRIP